MDQPFVEAGATRPNKADHAIDALVHEHRRQLLIDLLDENPHDASAQLAPTEGPNESNARQTARAAMLYRYHLPKLVEYGYVRYLGDGQIAKGERFGEVRPLLESVRELVEG